MVSLRIHQKLASSNLIFEGGLLGPFPMIRPKISSPRLMDGMLFWLAQGIDGFADIIELSMTYKIAFDILSHGGAMALATFLEHPTKFVHI